VPHEPAQAVVPVVVARQGVDGLGIILIGKAEFVHILVYVPIRIDDVATDDHELRTLSGCKQRRHESPLRLVSFTGVTHDEKPGRVEIRTVDDKVFRDMRALPLGGHQATALVIDRVLEETCDPLVAPR
jgi:hypothetical protein